MDNTFAAIPIFVAVVECGSFSSAAEKLNITKSAVSKRVTQLEDDLGIRLLNRTTRKLSLTEAGERYYYHVSQALSYAQQGSDAVTELQGEPQGKLKITAPMSFGVLHIATIIAEFLARYPKVEIDLGYRKYKPPFCSSSEVSYLKFPHSFTAQAPILTAGPA
ncbi:TPA: LysR family transcriptional regulator [Escherichia coli]|nr:LysR family transcriptional regulator [Escherichia coli]HCQ0066265.1 LysR family transcriptional regulator [Escherichia coli]